MFGDGAGDLSDDVRQELANQLVERVRTGLWISLAAVPPFVIADVFADRGLFATLFTLRMIQAGALAAALFAVRTLTASAWAVSIALGAFAVVFGLTAEVGVLTGDAAVAPLLAVVVPLVSATLVPWGTWPQCAIVGIVAAVALFNLDRVGGGLAGISSYSAGAVGLVWIVSVYESYEIERHRVRAAKQDLERRRAEAEKAALLDVARHISGTLDLREILDRVERLVAVLLPCDRVVTVYWDSSRQAFRLFSQYGTPSGLLPEAAAMKFSPEEPIANRLLKGETIVINDITTQQWLSPDMLGHFHIAAMIIVPLVVRGRMLGALTAVSAQPERGFSESQAQLFEGIARHVAVAIGTADLYRLQQEEAEVSTKLAHVGREMMSSLNTRILLDRLCQLSCEALGANYSHIWLRLADEEAIGPVASSDPEPDKGEGLRAVRIPFALVTQLMDRLQRDDVVPVVYGKCEDVLPSEISDACLAIGATRCIYFALRRGSEVIGLLENGFFQGTDTFSSVQIRIAHGIAQIAALAMEHWRLIEELERANRLKSDFVATMSHELRTPLNVIIGYNSLLMDGEFGPLSPDQHETADRIGRSATELLGLINATLDLSRLEAGRMRLDIRETWVQDFVAEVDADIREQRERPGLNFAWQVADGLPAIHTDPTKLKVVLKNLIGNAIKFTGQGNVTVRVDARDGGVEFSVIDSGIGIAPEARVVIFEAFRQADSSMSRRFGGTGLGLYIVNRLMGMLGGTVELESEIGRGSTFRVWVPREADQLR